MSLVDGPVEDQSDEGGAIRLMRGAIRLMRGAIRLMRGAIILMRGAIRLVRESIGRVHRATRLSNRDELYATICKFPK